MFTGLVEELGSIRRVDRGNRVATFEIEAARVVGDMQTGDSIAVSGVCLTVREVKPWGFSCDAVPETLERTTLGQARVGEQVNLERALALGQRLGGHLVQGHIDAVGRVLESRRQEDALVLSISIPNEIRAYLVPKGSVAVDGVSLTIANLNGTVFSLAVIPHTAQVTTLGQKQAGHAVNLEGDILGKYVERLLQVESEALPGAGRQETLTLDFLQRYGMA